jgi:hypothetical protein
MRARFLPVLALAMAAPAGAAETLFECSFGATRVSVTLEGERLTYRYGRPNRAELVLSGDRSSNNVFYHRQIYARAEDQTLRFTNGAYSYLIYARWQAPSQYQGGTTPERAAGGLLVLRDGALVRHMRCRSGGDMREWPVFVTLPEDPENLTPDDA